MCLSHQENTKGSEYLSGGSVVQGVGFTGNGIVDRPFLIPLYFMGYNL